MLAVASCSGPGCGPGCFGGEGTVLDALGIDRRRGHDLQARGNPANAYTARRTARASTSSPDLHAEGGDRWDITVEKPGTSRQGPDREPQQRRRADWRHSQHDAQTGNGDSGHRDSTAGQGACGCDPHPGGRGATADAGRGRGRDRGGGCCRCCRCCAARGPLRRSAEPRCGGGPGRGPALVRQGDRARGR